MASKSTVTRDEVFDLLSNERRRFALAVCAEAETPVELGELSEQIAALERDKSVGEVSYDERRSVYSAMQQTHLPTMQAAGVVEVHRSRVELTAAARELETYLDAAVSESRPWDAYYLSLSTVAVVLVSLEWLSVYPHPAPGLRSAGILVLLFLVSSLYHVWSTRHSCPDWKDRFLDRIR